MKTPQDRFLEKNGEIYQKCITCQEFKILSPKYFYKSPRFRTGLMSRCIECVLENDKRKDIKRTGFSDNMKKWEREGLEFVLRDVMGYEIHNPDNPVSKQFYKIAKEKYGFDFDY